MLAIWAEQFKVSVLGSTGGRSGLANIIQDTVPADVLATITTPAVGYGTFVRNPSQVQGKALILETLERVAGEGVPHCDKGRTDVLILFQIKTGQTIDTCNMIGISYALKSQFRTFGCFEKDMGVRIYIKLDSLLGNPYESKQVDTQRVAWLARGSDGQP